MSQPKFPECLKCKFYLPRVKPRLKKSNPICGECGVGEFFEERISTKAPSNDELMSIYRKSYDE